MYGKELLSIRVLGMYVHDFFYLKFVSKKYFSFDYLHT